MGFQERVKHVLFQRISAAASAGVVDEKDISQHFGVDPL